MNRKILASIVAVFMSSQAYSTVDFKDNMWIVMEDYNTDFEYTLENVKFGNCAGIPPLTTIDMFTSEYKIPHTGCGMPIRYENVNALTCLKASATNHANIFEGQEMNVKGIILDFSSCNFDTDSAKKALPILASLAAAKTFKISVENILISDSMKALTPTHVVKNVAANDTLNVRRHIGTQHDVVCKLKNNTLVWTISHQESSSNGKKWVVIIDKSGDCQGWVNTDYLKKR